MSNQAKRTGLLASGIVVLLAGLLTGLGLWVSSGQRESDAAANLARAPIGCDTTLDFEAVGEFYVYIESAGRFDDAVSGDCGAAGEFELSEDSLPPVTLQLTGPDGGDVVLDSRAGISYDTGVYVGTSVRSFVVDEPGSYQLRVETPGSAGETFAAAIGRDPADGVGSMRLGAVLAALGGLIIGGILILLSRRASDPEPAPAAAVWPGQATGWPTAPPGMPAAPSAPPVGGSAPLGPPTYSPVPPPGAVPPTPAGGGWPPQTTPPSSPTGESAPLREGAWGGVPIDGSSGDGERSPWAPPADSAQ